MGTNMVQMAHKHISAVNLQRGNKECISCKRVIIASNTQGWELGCTHIRTPPAVWKPNEIIYLHPCNQQQ